MIVVRTISWLAVCALLVFVTDVHAQDPLERQEEIEFGTVILGDSGTRVVFPVLRTGVNETWVRLYDPALPFENTTPNGPEPIGDTFAFAFRFKPMRGGVYEDSTAIVRVEGGLPRDTLIVRMRGIGRSLSSSVTIDWVMTMVGDFAAQSEDFYGPAYVIDQYRVVRSPQAPFITALVNDKPSVSDPDSIRVSVAFEPLRLGSFLDTLMLVRYFRGATPLDTLLVALDATSRIMIKDTTVQFRGVTVGATDTLNLFLRLPTFFVTRNFQYELESLDDGPMVGEVDPDRPTRRTVITNRIIAQPLEYRNLRQRFMLRRKSTQTDVVWDSTLINVDLLMSPRPVGFRLRWDRQPVAARIGDTVRLTLQAVTDNAFDAPVLISGVNTELTYNPTILIPLPGPAQQRTVVSDTAVWTIGLPDGDVVTSDSVTNLNTLTAVIALGDTDHSLLIARAAELTVAGESPRAMVLDTNRITLTNVYRYGPNGTPRYVNPFMQDLVLSIEPNPIISGGLLVVDRVPTGKGALQIIDPMGQVIADLSAEVRSGTRSFTIGTGPRVNIPVSPGSYYAALTVEGDVPGSLARIVRLFIVQ